MEVILKIGLDAGKLRDVRALYARRMIDAGEAIDPNAPVDETLASGGEVSQATLPVAHVGERGGETILPSSAVDNLLGHTKKARRG